MQTAITTEAGPREFQQLTLAVRAAGLFERRLGYYGVKVVVTVAAFGAGWLGFFLLGDSWATLAIAAFLGVAATQLGFLGHDAGHRQIFESRRANRLLGLGIGNGLIGLSYGWWVPKHNAHHAHPNELGRDPDIGVGLPSAGAHRDDPDGELHGVARWLDRWQAQLFFPLMLLRSTGLYVSGFQDVIRRRRERSVLTEGALLVAHVALYLTVVFWVLSPTKAIAFIAVHQAAFSLYLGCSFAPNHKGMPLLEDGTEMCFARRQVITARNLSGGRLTGFLFGGLNYQIEHHLFPTMPRPNLARAQAMVRAFCHDNQLGYAEARPLASYVLAVRALQVA
ncbi:MAG TPA: acyl-CoA desaturase [Acidimicrobiales bacterium]|nr:acyl-CoA desaturase [Acidimicrobiales bacterium]